MASPNPDPYPPSPPLPLLSALLPELHDYLLMVASPCTSICLGLTCTTLFNLPNRPRVSLKAFARLVCEEGHVGMLPFLLSCERADPEASFLFEYAHFEAAVKAGHEELVLALVEAYLLRKENIDYLASHADRAAAQSGNMQLARRLEQLLVRSPGAVEEGLLIKGDPAVLDLPNSFDRRAKALQLAPLSLIKQLFPEGLSGIGGWTAERFGLAAASSPYPEVLPWCVSHGLSLRPYEQGSLYDVAMMADRLENFLFVLSLHRHEDISPFLSLGLNRLAERILRHFFHEDKEAIVGLTRSPWIHKAIFSRAPSYRHALDFLVEIGLLEYAHLPIYPELAYLKRRVQLGWIPAEEPKCLEKLAEAAERWHPALEGCTFFLLQQGAQLTVEFFNKVVVYYRLSFLYKIISLGCPVSSISYQNLAGCPTVPRFAERYWFLRRACPRAVPTWPHILGHCIREESLEILQDLLALQTSDTPATFFDSMFCPSDDFGSPLPGLPRFDKAFRLLAAKSKDGRLPSSILRLALRFPSMWARMDAELTKADTYDIDLGGLLAFLDLLRAHVAHVDFSWLDLLLPVADSDWLKVSKYFRAQLPTVLRWFVGLLGPVAVSPDQRPQLLKAVKALGRLSVDSDSDEDEEGVGEKRESLVEFFAEQGVSC